MKLNQKFSTEQRMKVNCKSESKLKVYHRTENDDNSLNNSTKKDKKKFKV